MQIPRRTRNRDSHVLARAGSPAHPEGVRIMRFRLILVAFMCLALVVPLAFAQTTGSVSGVVRDKDGGPLPGVTVTISGPQMPRGQTTTTLADGSFKFQALLPGVYHVKAELPGMVKWEQDVVVALEKNTEVYPSIGMTAAAQVTVTAEYPLVDTKATDVSKVTPKETIEKLPLARTFTGHVSTRARRRGEQLERSQRRRRQTGQHVPLRRRHHHQPVLRRPLPGLRRARHPGGQHHPRRRDGGVRPDRRLHRQRRHQVRHQRPARRGAARVPARRRRRQEQGSRRSRASSRSSGPAWTSAPRS